MQDIFSYIANQRQEYDTQPIELPGGGDFTQSDMIVRNNKNWRSEYYTPQSDNVIGTFPYDNIAKPIVLLEARATDFALRHIEVEPKNQTRKARVSAMLATKAIQEYGRKYGLAKTLDEITFTRPKQGGVLVKRTIDGPRVVPWENVITDQMDIMSSPIIERHYYTPAEIRREKWNAEKVTEAIKSAIDEKQADVDNTGRKNNTVGSYIEVFEVHGEIPVSMFMQAKADYDGETYEYDEEDEYRFVRACVITTLISSQNQDGAREDTGLVLYAKEEKEPVYMYLARNPQAGRALGESVYESLREHQRWHNYSKTEEARMMAVAGKVLFKTNQPDAMTNIFNGKVDHGTVLKLGNDPNGQPNFFEQVNNVPVGTPIYQGMREEWADSARMITSAHAAKLGEEAKAGTPFRAQYLQNIEASSQFEKYRNEIGEQLIQPMIEKWVLPDAIKELLEEDEIYTNFSPQELQLIDDVLIEKAKTRAIVDASLAGRVIGQEEVDMAGMDTQTELTKFGTKRSIKKFKEALKDIPGRVVIHVTDEMRAKAVLFESYANLLSVLAPEDPRRNAVIDRIMDSMGITTEEIALYANAPVPTTPTAQPKINTTEASKVETPQLQAAL